MWPTSDDDRAVVPLHPLDLPIFRNLETVDFHYVFLWYDPEWFRYTDDFNEQDATKLWRQNIVFAAARLAMYVPQLSCMTITQRPMMWAGVHGIRYGVRKECAELLVPSSFEFELALVIPRY